MDRFEKDFLEGISNAFIEDAIEKLLEISPQYNKNYKEREIIMEQLHKLKTKLSEEERKCIEKYENNHFIIRDLERSWLYLQGYRDCIKFLKLFKVI